MADEILAVPLDQLPESVDDARADEREKAWIEAGHPIPPSVLLRPGSPLFVEALRIEAERLQTAAVKANVTDAEIAANEGDFTVEEVAAMLNSRTPAMQALLTANPDDDGEA